MMAALCEKREWSRPGGQPLEDRRGPYLATAGGISGSGSGKTFHYYAIASKINRLIGILKATQKQASAAFSGYSHYYAFFFFCNMPIITRIFVKTFY